MNWNRLFTLSFLIAALLLAPVTVLPAAELKLAAVLSDHMVLHAISPCRCGAGRTRASGSRWSSAVRRKRPPPTPAASGW